MPTRWNTTPDKVFLENLDNFVGEIYGITNTTIEKYTPQIEEWMKENAKWDDHTYNARSGLSAEPILTDTGASIKLSYGGVAYGVYLEMSNSGRFAIIGPAMDYWFPIIWADISQQVKRMSYARRAEK